MTPFEEYAETRGYRIQRVPPEPGEVDPPALISRFVGGRLVGRQISEQLIRYAEPSALPAIFDFLDAEVSHKAAEAELEELRQKLRAVWEPPVARAVDRLARMLEWINRRTR